MADMSLREFRQTVKGIVKPKLAQQGYGPSSSRIIASDNHSVQFEKMLAQDICGAIVFQRSKNYIPPTLEFQVFLMRAQMTKSVRSKLHYAPLGVSLRNLVEGLHQKDIFEPGIYAWKFTDRQSLNERLEHALSLIMKYGICWLEDPNSNMNWTQYLA